MLAQRFVWIGKGRITSTNPIFQNFFKNPLTKNPLTKNPLNQNFIHTQTPLLIQYSNPLKNAKKQQDHDDHTSSHFVYHKHPLNQASDETKQTIFRPSRKDYLISHPVYTDSELKSIEITHKNVKGIHDSVAFLAVKILRGSFDLFTGYGFQNFNETMWLRRFIFLETVAGVPGMVGGMARHMRSLRRMKRDHGWINTLLQEAENERMHLLTFMQLRSPGRMFRGLVLVTQGIFFNAFFLAYLISPKTCHSFVGYLEEEAVKTYTHAIEDLRSGKLPEWKNKPAPEIAFKYWKLPENATMEDLLLNVRADEANHRDTNHTLAKLQTDQDNPVAF